MPVKPEMQSKDIHVMVTAQYLLEGAFYALEQCGILLRDAVTLYEAEAYSSTIVLAAFAREELGRSRILRELRKKIVEQGKNVTLKDIRNACEDHVKKQTRAQLSVVQRVSDDEHIAKLLKARIHNPPQSEAYKTADRQLDDITKRQQKRTPEDRHRKRVCALYVEPTGAGLGWSRPREKSQDEARVFLEDAVNDYALEYDHMQQETIQKIDPELSHALQVWKERPELPLPSRPWT